MQPFNPDIMVNPAPGSEYNSKPVKPGFLTRAFPNLSFYIRTYLIATRWLSSWSRKHGRDDNAWCYGSAWVLEELEKSGVRIHIDGLENLDKLNGGPCVIEANHMSTLETFILPSIVSPRFPVTFVVKKSLVEMPGFGVLMRSRDPVVVDRKSPREDLAVIMNEGLKRLNSGTSIIVFPQATRQRWFSDLHFNSIGVKLAKKAGVPLLPLALKTDAWGIGEYIKELGPINPKSEVMMRFFPPLTIHGSGHAEHIAARTAIHKTVDYWEMRQNAMDQGLPEMPVTDPRFKLPELFSRED